MLKMMLKVHFLALILLIIEKKLMIFLDYSIIICNFAKLILCNKV